MQGTSVGRVANSDAYQGKVCVFGHSLPNKRHLPGDSPCQQGDCDLSVLILQGKTDSLIYRLYQGSHSTLTWSTAASWPVKIVLNKMTFQFSPAIFEPPIEYQIGGYQKIFVPFKLLCYTSIIVDLPKRPISYRCSL